MRPTIEEGESEGRAIEAVVAFLSRTVCEISNLPECRSPFRRSCCDLARRVKLLSPLLDEIHDGIGEGSVDGVEIGALSSLLAALTSAMDLLQSVSEGSKIYQALQRDRYAIKFQQVTRNIEDALNGVPYNKLNISQEVKEQIELVHAQFQRAKEREDSPDLQLLADLSLARIGKYSDPMILKRLSEKLQLRTINDMKQESLALHEMVIANGGDPEDCIEEMSSLLRKLKDCVLTETPVSENLEAKESSLRFRSPVIPDDFRCPISLELMRDPVIVSTGQTYERSCIQKWLDSGHRTCPKTQQNLSHSAVNPNFVLKSLITQWCEANGIEPPKKSGSCRERRSGSRHDCDRATIKSLLEKLERGNQEE